MSGPTGEPYPSNGTSEDILSLLARAEERRYRREGTTLPRKTAAARLALEPWLNAAGVAVRCAMELLPAGIAGSVHDRVLAAVAGGSGLPFEADAPGLKEASELRAELERSSGKAPALLCAMSHPPVTPEFLNLNVEMTRQVLLALPRVRGRPCRPRMVVAVDPYALDMLPLLREAAYAGFMGTFHLGFDRLARNRAAASRAVIGAASWVRLPWRMVRMLSAGREAGIVLAGGIPTTARTLYAAREFLMRLRRGRSSEAGPRAALRRLAGYRPDFARFLESPLIGASLRRSAWRAMEAWVVAGMVGEWPPGGDDRLSALGGGRVGPELSGALRSIGLALGIPAVSFEEALRRFEEEFSRETPYRERFFRFLAGRVVRRGTPVVLVPLSHHVDTPSGGPGRRIRLEWGRPVALLKYENDRITVRDPASFTAGGDRSSLAAAAPGGGGPSAGRLRTMEIADFARDFVRSRYP